MKAINHTLLPYGIYHERNAIVIHDRCYRPIVRITDGGIIAPCAPDEWISFVDQSWFYSDGTSPRINAHTRKMLNSMCSANPVLEREIKRRAKLKEVPCANRWDHVPLAA